MFFKLKLFDHPKSRNNGQLTVRWIVVSFHPTSTRDSEKAHLDPDWWWRVRPVLYNSLYFG